MKKDNETMLAEDFFDCVEDGEKGASRKRRVRGQQSAEALLEKVKIKMVMRIYGVSRARALKIIAGCAEEPPAEETAAKEAAKNKRAARRHTGEFKSADYFFV